MQHMKRILAAAAAAVFLRSGTAGILPAIQPVTIPQAAQLRQLMQTLSALPAPAEPFATLRLDRGSGQLYCDGTAVGTHYAGCTVRDGTLRISASSLGIPPEQSPHDTLTPEEAAQLAGIEYTESPDGIRIRSPFGSSRLILQCSGELPESGNAADLAEINGMHILQYGSPAEAYAAYRQFQADSRIRAVQPDCIYHADVQGIPVDPANRDSAVSLIGADSYCEWLCAEKSSLPEIQIAVLDTGIYAEHNWFQGRIAEGGITMVTNDSDKPTDAYGHGTHCAGIIAQSTPENVKILPVKVLSDRGYGYGTEIYCGMLYAVEQGAEIVSMSLGGDGEDFLLDAGIAALKAADVLCIAAAGNEQENAKYHHPARNPDCITISSVTAETDADGNRVYSRSSFSNYGACIDFCAPGSSIRSAFPEKPDQLWTLSGTSMATPFAAAACADLLSYDPSLTGDQVYALLRESAADLGREGFDTDFGWGMIDLSAVRFAEPLPDPAGNTDTGITDDPGSEAETAYAPGAESCKRIRQDQPFIHDSGQYSLLLDADAQFILRAQSGEEISGTLKDVRHPAVISGITSAEITELEAGNYLLTLDKPAQTDPAKQEIFTLQTVRQSLYMAEIVPADAEYTGETVTPHAAVTLNGVTLREGIDYTIRTGKTLTKPGRYRLTVEGMGAYYDSRDFTFRILPDLSGAALLTEGENTAEIREPGEAVSFRWIPEQTQYCFLRTDNRPGSIRIYDADGNPAGSLGGIFAQYAVVDVIPQAEYRVAAAFESPTLTGSLPFTVTSDFRLLETCTVQMPARIAADTENGIPQYAVFDGDTELTEGVDYTVLAAGGTEQPGVADIAFLGTGKYCGILEQAYEICPASPPADAEATALPCGSTLTMLRRDPGTMQLFRFTAPADGSYRFLLPSAESDGISTFVYDGNGRLLDAAQTEFTLSEAEELQILCVTMTLTSQFSANDTYQLQAAAMNTAQEWEADGIRYRLIREHYALVTGAEHAAYGGIRIPDSIAVPGKDENAMVGGIDAALRAEIARTHTIYGSSGGIIEACCREMSLCFAAEELSGEVPGDLTGDGIVTADDLLTLNRILSECPGMRLNEAVMQAADLHADGILDLNDLRMMLTLTDTAS